MTTSVVLSTYNGEKYLINLLDTLRLQTVEIDEVLISDDCSTDGTVSLISHYISAHDLENWKLEVNDKNLGWEKNFYLLILKASGNLIFPCDQDDLWAKDKIEKCIQAMEENEDALLICSDYELIYMSNSVSFPRPRISKINSSGSVEKINTKRAVQIVDRPGCTFCIKKELLPIMNAIWISDCPHDALAWRAASISDGLYIFHEKLIKFRRHDTNASDQKKHTLSERIKLAEYYIAYLSKLKEFRGEASYSSMGKYLSKCIKAQKNRCEYLYKKSIMMWIFHLYEVAYLPSIRTYIMDGLCIVKRK